MGHNLGMSHDCKDGRNGARNLCAYWDKKNYVGPRVLNGKECYGYMDYKDDTNYWSHCTVSDFTTYLNANNFCLRTIDRGKYSNI